MVRLLLSLVIGLVIGVIIGLYLGWFQFPVEYLDSPISRLDPQYRDAYTVMIANGYRSDGDVLAAIERLRVLGIEDVPSFVFQQAERYIANSRDLSDIRALIALSEGLGRTSAQFDSYREAAVPEGG